MAWGKQRTGCRRCWRGTCGCNAIAKADREKAAKSKAPRVCGQRRRDGGTCHRTVSHGETCSARH
jgi:hypothetical protein